MSATSNAASIAGQGLWRALRHNWAIRLEAWALRVCPPDERLATVELLAEKGVQIDRLKSEVQAWSRSHKKYRDAIWATANQPTYDDTAIRKAVTFELAEMIADERAQTKPIAPVS